VDRETHARYLEYRERHRYFGGSTKMLGAAEFEPLDREQRALDMKGEDARDDEEEARYVELSKVLFRD
jgi:hypothetical protein